MGCNSCSNITLPGNAGTQGAPGPPGNPGSPGAPGADGASVSVLDVDFTQYNGAVPSYPSTPQKSVTIPADTWKNVDDMLELEMMFQTRGKVYSGSEPHLKVEVGGAVVDLYTPNANTQLDFFSDLGVNPSSNNIVKVRLQLPMFQNNATVGRIRPVIETDVFTGTNSGNEYYSISASAKSIYGRSTNLVIVGDITTAVPIDVYMMHSDPTTPLPFKMVYYKLLSYKKIV